MCPSCCYTFPKSFSPSSAAMSRHDILRKGRVTASKSQLDQHSGVQIQFLAKDSIFQGSNLNRVALLELNIFEEIFYSRVIEEV